MSVSHYDALRLLFPLGNVGGHHEQDVQTEARALDLLQARATALLAESQPATAYHTLEDWERVYGTSPAIDATLQQRRSAVVQKMRELGRLDLAYFQGLAEGLGFEVVIEELKPFMTDWSGVEEELLDDDADYCWRVYVNDTPGGYFRVDESAVGEPLSDGYQAMLGQIFEQLKPAHTIVIFETQ